MEGYLDPIHEIKSILIHLPSDKAGGVLHATAGKAGRL